MSDYDDEPLWEPAGFWLRFFAMVLDGIIFSLVIATLFFGLTYLGVNLISMFMEQVKSFSLSAQTIASALTVTGTLFAIAPALIWLFYFALFESTFGGTPAKLAFGLKVTDYSRESIEFSRALKRNFYKNLYWLILVLGLVTTLSLAVAIPFILVFTPMIVWGLLIVSGATLFIGHIAAAFTIEKQALHDQLSDALVLKNTQTSTLWRFLLIIITIALAVFLHQYEDRDKKENVNVEKPGFEIDFSTIKQWFGTGDSRPEKSEDERQQERRKLRSEMYRSQGVPDPLEPNKKWRYIRPDDNTRSGESEGAKWWYSGEEKPKKN